MGKGVIMIVGRYEDYEFGGEWQGWMEDEEKTWIIFIRRDGSSVTYLHRDETGALL